LKTVARLVVGKFLLTFSKTLSTLGCPSLAARILRMAKRYGVTRNFLSLSLASISSRRTFGSANGVFPPSFSPWQAIK